MLQSTFNTIKQHFSPSSPIDKNIFLLKDYDYPSPFQQKLYLSYLDLEDTFKTKPQQQIAKRINIVTNKNDKNLQKTILGFVYALVLHSPKATKSLQQKQQTKQKPNLLDSTQDSKQYSQKMLLQLDNLFKYFRNQTWELFNIIALDILMNYFAEIKPPHKFGFIAILKYMQRLSATQYDYFIALMKTLNFYDHKILAMKYNIELLHQLHQIILNWKKTTTNKSPNNPYQLQAQNSFANIKINQQMSLMRHYLFGKLLHWQYMTQKISAYLKGEWPINLQRTCTETLKILKSLFHSNPEECLVFSAEYSRYAEFQTQDYQVKEILTKIIEASQKPLAEHMVAHHFNLVPISIEFLLPNQIEQKINETGRNLYEVPQQSTPFPRVERQNVHMIMGWVWKDCIKEFSQEKNKNYLVENTFQDIVRWCLMAHSKNLQLRSFIIEWVLYSTGHNEALSRTTRQAFFWDWLYYLKIAPEIDFNAIFSILSTSLHILNYFAFCAPNLAQGLFVHILGKGIFLKTSYQTGVTSEGIFRVYMNEILKRANRDGILRVREILYQSQLSNYVKMELEQRIKEGESVGIESYGKEVKEKPREVANEKYLAGQNTYIPQSGRQKIGKQSIIEQKKFMTQKPQYYGDKQLNVQFEGMKRNMTSEDHSDEDDLIYTSHQLIPSSPTYGEENEPHYNEEINYNEQKGFSLEDDVNVIKGQIDLKRSQPQPHAQQPKLDRAQKSQEKYTTQFSPEYQYDPSRIVQQDPYPQPNQSQTPLKPQISSKTPSCYQILLQKQFLQQMGPAITALIHFPTVSQFTQYMKELLKVLKQYKKSSQQQEMIEKFIHQTTKLIYLIFNKQFESFDFTCDETKHPKDSLFMTYFLLKSIHQNWKQSLVIYNIFVYKKLVRALCDAFPSAEYTFYFVFLDIFKRGTVHFKEMKAWLIPTQKEKTIVPVLQKILGKNFKMHIYENAQVLKLQ